MFKLSGRFNKITRFNQFVKIINKTNDFFFCLYFNNTDSFPIFLFAKTEILHFAKAY